MIKLILAAVAALTVPCTVSASKQDADDVMVLPANTHLGGCEVLGSAIFSVRQWNVYGSGAGAIQKLTKKYTDRARELGANVVLLDIVTDGPGAEVKPGVFLRCKLPITTEDPTAIRTSQ
jgi:hypothetical protein